METLSNKKTPWKYVALSYGLFWLMVLILGGGASMIFNASPTVMRIIANLCAWSPTFAVLIMFKKLYPGKTMKEVFKGMFEGKLKLSLVLISGLTIIIGMGLSIWITSGIDDTILSDYIQPGLYSLPIAFLFSLTSGPTGEEAGWRGYLRPTLEKRYGLIKAALISGVIWAFWHTILWFIDVEFTGLDLIIYMLSNVFVMTSLTMIMHIILNNSNNLLYAIWIHLCFNFIYVYLNVGITFYIVMSVVFVIIAAIYMIYYLYNQKSQN